MSVDGASFFPSRDVRGAGNSNAGPGCRVMRVTDTYGRPARHLGGVLDMQSAPALHVGGFGDPGPDPVGGRFDVVAAVRPLTGGTGVAGDGDPPGGFETGQTRPAQLVDGCMHLEARRSLGSQGDKDGLGILVG